MNGQDLPTTSSESWTPQTKRERNLDQQIAELTGNLEKLSDEREVILQEHLVPLRRLHVKNIR